MGRSCVMSYGRMVGYGHVVSGRHMDTGGRILRDINGCRRVGHRRLGCRGDFGLHGGRFGSLGGLDLGLGFRPGGDR